MSSLRAQNGFTTKGSTAVIVTPTEYSGSDTLQKYNQGVNVNDINVLIGSTPPKLRSNNDFLKIRYGVRSRIDEGSFDDTESPSSLVWVSGSVGSVYQKSYIPMTFFQIVPTGSGVSTGEKYTGCMVAPSHFMLDNDFGQPDTYQDGTSFVETAILKGISGSLTIIESSDPSALPVPSELVNSSDVVSRDGAIDPFNVMREIDRSVMELMSFRIKGTRSDLVTIDTHRRSVLIQDQQPILSKIEEIDPFLDTGDEFGINEIFDISAAVSTGLVGKTGFINPPTKTIRPYVDSSDAELTAELIVSSSYQPDIVNLLVRDSNGLRPNFPTSDFLGRNHVSLPHGFDYDNSETGIDSLAFGGLLK